MMDLKPHHAVVLELLMRYSRLGVHEGFLKNFLLLLHMKVVLFSVQTVLVALIEYFAHLVGWLVLMVFLVLGV